MVAVRASGSARAIAIRAFPGLPLIVHIVVGTLLDQPLDSVSGLSVPTTTQQHCRVPTDAPSVGGDQNCRCHLALS